jgi:hypothetical protein
LHKWKILFTFIEQTTSNKMETTPAVRQQQLPDIKDLYGDLEMKQDANRLNVLLNQNPAKGWLRQHPTATKKVNGRTIPIDYIPIERIEWLLTRIFIRWYVEVKAIQQVANSIVVTVTLHYLDPLSSEWMRQDGIGAAPMQTNAGAGATDWMQIKSAAVQIGAPAAESYAIKDAAEKIGKLFGKDINRADQIGYDNLISALPSDEPISAAMAERIFRLLQTSTLPQDQRDVIDEKLVTMTAREAVEVTRMLLINQSDVVADGNYNATDIQVKLFDIIKDDKK